MGEPQERSGRARRQRLAAASGSPLTAPHRTSPHHAEVPPGEGEHLLQTFLQVGALVRRDACGRGGGQGRAGLGSGGAGAPRGSAAPAQPTRPRREPRALERSAGTAVGVSLGDEITLFCCCCCWGFSTTNGLCKVS